MSLCTLIGTVVAKDETREELRKILAGQVAPTRAEPGCVNYDFHVDAKDPNVFVFYENWRTRADLDAHLKAPHLQSLFGRPVHTGSRLDEAFLDLARRESIKLTIPDSAHIRRNLRQMRSLGMSLEAEPHDQVRRDGDDFFPCRIKEWQAH